MFYFLKTTLFLAACLAVPFGLTLLAVGGIVRMFFMNVVDNAVEIITSIQEFGPCTGEACNALAAKITPLITAPMLGLIALFMLAIMLCGAMIQGYLRKVGLNVYAGHPQQYTNFMAVFRRIPTLFLTFVLAGIATLCGLALFVIPGLILFYGFIFIDFVVMDHATIGALDALKESWRITRGNFFRLAVMFLSMQALWTLFSKLVTFIQLKLSSPVITVAADAVAVTAPANGALILFSILQILVYFVVLMPAMLLTFTHAYKQLHISHGLDTTHN